MNRTITLFLFIIVFFINISQVKSQSISNEKQSLVSVLEQLEKKFNVRFSYADAYLEGKEINKLPNDLSLQNLLNLLEEETNLIFEFLDNSTIVIRNNSINDITKTQFLDEVLVSNFLTKGISLRHGGTTQIKPKEFGILPGLIEPDVLQTIQALPGVISIDERVSNLNVRGGTHDQNLILWDGIKMYQSGHFFGLISAFNPYLTEHVVVSKNGTSARYGDGVSSIIDMQSSNRISNKFSGGFGSNLVYSNAYAKIPITKKVELQLSARRSITDVVSTPTYDEYFERIFQDSDFTNQNNNASSINERFYFYDVSAKTIYNISEKDQININLLSIHNTLNYEEVSTSNNIIEATKSDLTQRNFGYALNYNRIWNDKLNTSVQLYLSHYDLFSTNNDIINSQILKQINEVNDNGLKIHANYAIDDNVKYFGGYELIEVSVSNFEDLNNPIFRRYVKEVLSTHAFFNEVAFKSNSGKTNTRIGIRSNYIEKFSDFFMEPRISFSQKFLNHFRFEILAEIKSQTTSQIIDLQNDFLGIEKRRWILANNEDVPLMQSEQISLGVHYNKNKLLLSIEGFMKNIYGITTRSQGFQNQFQFINDTGAYRVRGIDFLINKQFNNISTWLSYSLSKNNYRFNNLNSNESFPNNYDIRHNINFAGTYSLKKFKLAFGLNWRTGKPYTKPDTDNPIFGANINYDSPNSYNINDYIRADISTTYNFGLSKRINAFAGFSLWNIFNKSNIINSYYILEDGNNIKKVDNRSLGLTPNFNFRISF